ncbi:hypothetical protein BFN03_07965 [Rhodococcus sp. WMMA185]|uniref:Rv1733c family protein n=1 Tax=Rhodococcus sp. WMMA185 TaxID=679318 RepID=UPI000878B586|nr:hypothetical protein [Rhodococcus sp. WMMA185]AOW92651.1 hypothetical protein BFN03_07965 [Rhodococcus sp. WMMA185]
MNTAQTPTVRWWRLAPWNRNPLMRASDRLDFVAAAVMIIALLMMVPIAAAFGTATYAGLNEQSQAQLRAGHTESATLIDDPRPSVVESATSRFPEVLDRATAQWSARDGTLRTAVVQTRPGAQRGDTVDVWVDMNGNMTDEPRPTAENAAIAVGSAVSVWVGAAVVFVLLFFGLRWMSTRSRMRQWDREWNDFGRTPEWPVG